MPNLSSTDFDVTDLLCQLIAIPSVNPMGRAVDGSEFLEARLSAWLVDFFSSIGAVCEVREVAPGRSNVIASLDCPNATTTLLLDVHQDTVGVDGMTIPPFEPEVRDGRVYGRGASDVKGSMAVVLSTFAKLCRGRPKVCPNVVVSCSCDEESTMLGIRDLVTCWTQTNNRNGLLSVAPDAAIVFEPTELNVVVAHRGVIRWQIRVSGTACHSSDPSLGENAIYKMAQVVRWLENYAQSLGQGSHRDPWCGIGSLSVGRIAGGTSVNIVPPDCEIEVERRLLPGEDAEQVLSTLRQGLCQDLGFDVHFEPAWIHCPSLTANDNGELADRLVAVAERADVSCKKIGVGYGTHASTIARTGIPTVVFGPGSISQAHTENEYIAIEQLEKASEILDDLVRRELKP